MLLSLWKIMGLIYNNGRKIRMVASFKISLPSKKEIKLIIRPETVNQESFNKNFPKCIVRTQKEGP
jgi:hypothetical protein